MSLCLLIYLNTTIEDWDNLVEFSLGDEFVEIELYKQIVERGGVERVVAGSKRRPQVERGFLSICSRQYTCVICIFCAPGNKS